MFKRGNIYLAKLYPSKGHEVGKTRPILVLQTNLLNDIGHTTMVIVPLTTQLIEGTYPLRYRISKIDKLTQDSEILCDQVRSIDINRLMPEEIGSLSELQMLEIEDQIKLILGFE